MRRVCVCVCESVCVADSDAFSGIIWNLSVRRKVLVGHPAEQSCFLAVFFFFF